MEAWTLKRTLKWMAGGVLALVACLVLAVAILQTAPAREVIRRLAVRELDAALNATVEIGGIGGDFITGLDLRDVRLRTHEGLAASVERVSCRYVLPLLFKRIVYLRSIDISGLVVNLITHADGTSNFSGLLKAGKGQQPPSAGAPFHLAVGVARVDRSRLRLSRAGDAASARVIEIQELAARIGYTRRLSVGIESARIAMNRPELRRLILRGNVLFDPAAGYLDVDQLVVHADAPAGSLGAKARFEGRMTGTGALDSAHLEVNLSPSTFKAWKVDEGSLTASVSNGRIRIASLGLSGNFGRILASGNGTGFMESAAPKRLDLSFHLSNPDLGHLPLRTGITGPATLDLTCEGVLPADYDLSKAAMKTRADLHDARVRLGDILLTAGRMSADIRGGRVRINGAHLATSAGAVEMSGVLTNLLSGKGAGQLRLSAHAADVDLAALLKQEPLRGRARLSASASGPMDRPTIRFRVKGKGVSSGAFSSRALSGSGKWRPGTGFGSGHALVEVTGAEYGGNRFKTLRLSASVADRALSFDTSLTHESGNGLSAAGHMDLSKTDRYRAVIDTLRFNAPTYAMLDSLVNKGPLKFAWNAHSLTVETFRMASKKARVTLGGHLTMGGENDLRLGISGLQLRQLSWLWGTKDRVKGIFSARATLRGTLAAPLMEAHIHGRGLSGRGFGPGDVDLDASYANGHAALSIGLEKGGRRLLAGRGTLGGALSLVPFSADFKKGPLDLSLTLKHLRLSELPALATREVVYDGVATGHLAVTGTVATPRLKGMLQLANGSLALRKNRLTYPSVAAKIFFNQQQIDIRELFLKTNGEGYLRGSGQVDLEGTTPTRCKLTLEGKDFFIPFQKAIEARVSPSLTLSGPMDALSLTGQVTIDQGKINLDRLVPQTPPDIQIVGAAAGGNGEERIAEEAPAPAFFRQLGARVRVKAPRNVWLKGQDLSTEIGGDLTLSKKPGESFRLLGELRTLRGFYYFQGRRFSVRKGTVNFIGLKEPNPGLDIEADAKIQDALIKVLISGTARQLVLTLDSEPKMDKSDIISYLVFGKPTDSLRGGGAFNVEKAALGFTGSLVASEMRRLLGDVFFLDSFSIESGEDGGLGAVSLGKYLRPDLYVSYQYTAGEEKTSEVDVSYEIDPNLRLETQLGNDRTSGADLFWEFDY